MPFMTMQTRVMEGEERRKEKGFSYVYIGLCVCLYTRFYVCVCLFMCVCVPYLCVGAYVLHGEVNQHAATYGLFLSPITRD